MSWFCSSSSCSCRKPFPEIHSPRVIFGIMALALLLFCPARALTDVYLKLAWDANDETDLDGYRIFVRAEGESYNYADPDWEGTATTCTIYGLADDTNYFFVARAFDIAGNESGDSNEEFYDAAANVPPTADAGPDRAVGEGASVTLDGSNSSDPDGSIASYAWAQTGGTAVSLSDPASAAPGFTAPLVATGGEALTFQLTVTDNGALAAADTVIINVSGANQAPTADAGSDRTVGEGVSVTLDGSNSYDADGTVVAYAWTQTGGGTVSLSGSSTAQPFFTAPDVGPNGSALTFQLTVTDNGGLQSSDSCIVNVSWVNVAPTANAGFDKTVNEGTLVALYGLGSSDPDDGIDAYLWNQTAGTPVTLSSPTSPTPQFTAPDVGPGGETLRFRLTVTDGGGLSDTDAMIVSVLDSNQAPNADAGPDRTVSEGESVTLDGSNSSDGNGNIVSYAWVQTGGTAVSLSDPASATPWFTSPLVGVGGEALTFALTVTDNDDLTADDTVIINVSDVNQAPTADAGSDRTVGEGEEVTLDGSNSDDADGTVVAYAWTQTGGPTVSLSGSSSAQPGFTTPDVGPNGTALTFQLTVTDNGGLQSSDSCIVNVSWVNLAPTANAGLDETVDEGTLVALDGTGSSDPDDGIDAYLWSQTAGTPVTLSPPSSPTPQFTSPYVGTDGEALMFQLTVRDGGGLSDTDTVIINVSNSNQAPTADAGPDQTVIEREPVVLSGAGSRDMDGTIVSFIWTQTGGTTVSLAGPSSEEPTFTAPDVGQGGATLIFELTVRDDGGLQSSDTCVVNVTWEDDVPPAPPGGITVTVGD